MSQSQTPPPGTPAPRPSTPPAGPTGPTPTGPGPQRGHLPIDIDCDYPPLLGQVIRDAERLAAQLISVLERDYDVASAPSAEDDPTGLGFVEVRLMSARADVRSALLMLDQITTLGLPPTGSAVPFPARQSTNSASLPGGPPNHLAASPASGGLLPGLPVGTCIAHGQSAATAPGRSAGESSGPIVSGTRAAVPAPAGSVSEGAQQAPCTAHRTGGGGAGPSSGPGLRLSQRAPDGNGVRPGAGFTLPVAKRIQMDRRSVESLAQHAVALNESLARRSR